MADNGIFYVVDATNNRLQRWWGAPFLLDAPAQDDGDAVGNTLLVRECHRRNAGGAGRV